ncbi:DICT sensory domain-containing protein [Halovenus halobia]|uniref:DICT sensory domain-containing protein n=1 Tax=Halovenus halobia TaxID=3396622 RepID=UPI003F56765A
MNLRQTINSVQAHEKELALFNIDADERIDEELRSFFRTQNVRITTAQTASGCPEEIAVLAAGETVLAVVEVETLRELVDGAGAQSRRLGVTDTAYSEVLSHLKETTFTSCETADMLYASREIEDRARRNGTGTVHAGFQRCSTIVSQQAIYEDLSRTGVSVHAYGVPDVTPPELAGGQVHAVGGEIADLWFVVYDGGSEESQKSALLAEEDSAGRFYGFWTYDSAIVDSVCQYLTETYLGGNGQFPQFRA